MSVCFGSFLFLPSPSSPVHPSPNTSIAYFDKYNAANEDYDTNQTRRKATGMQQNSEEGSEVL